MSETCVTGFFRKVYPFSNHRPCAICLDGILYNSTEQFYMCKKAEMFGDKEAAHDIMSMADPGEMKRRSKTIKGFKQLEWDKVCQDIMKVASRAKYEQNESLRNELFKTHGTLLAECSPYDRKWGIGLGLDDPRSLDPKSWRGKNLLGNILTDLREEMMKEEKYKIEVDKILSKKK